jgi:outer membrane receptor protein involved in Fe transport
MKPVKPLPVLLTILVVAASLRAQQAPLHTNEVVTVTAYGTPLAADQSATSTIVLTPQQLQQSPAVTFGDTLRDLPGVEFFRRTGTLIANPTSQGLSLRGLGSTSSSRTLVLSDHIPLNDAFGGWVHWEEFPILTVQSVEVVRGGASDLYGSSAVGGVVNILRIDPDQTSFSLLASGGSQNTANVSSLANWIHRQWSAQAAGGILRTGGYIVVAPGQRGPVDTRYNAHIVNGSFLLQRALTAQKLFARVNLYNDNRANGTPDQTNADRIWRYSVGDDISLAHAQHITARIYGSENHYRQSFSQISNTPVYRGSETLTRLLRTPSQEIGAIGQYSAIVRNHLTLFAGADIHDVRGTDLEIPITAGVPGMDFNVSARQRDTGFFGEALFNRNRWTLSAGGRIDHFSNLDTIGTLILPGRSETVANPRLGVVYRAANNVALTGSAFRAFRSPTLYELFRTGQVGSITTLANYNLLSERATGWETGVQLAAPARNLTAHISYFWTIVNRPITAVTIAQTPPPPAAPVTITKQRENLGQIRSDGVTVDAAWQPRPWIALLGGYQFADATVTKNPANTSLVGHWIPEVAHNTGSADLRLSQKKIGSLSFIVRTSGRSFDDDENTEFIHGYTRFDAYLEHAFGTRLILFASGQNLSDRTIQAGLVPQITLASRRTAEAGLRLNLTR